MLCTGAGENSTLHNNQMSACLFVSLCCSTPPSQKTNLFSASFARSHCPAEFLSNNPDHEFLHSWIPPSDPRELTIGQTFQLCKYKKGHCERSKPTNRAAGTQWNRIWPHNKATQGIAAIKGGGLLFIPQPRSDVLLPPHMNTSVSGLLFFITTSEITMKASPGVMLKTPQIL